jgi:hypothetical protein
MGLRTVICSPNAMVGAKALSTTMARVVAAARKATGRQLFLIVSDCVSPAWHSGRVGQMIGRWGQRCPVTILQMLPERLWSRTALSTESAQLGLPYPGAPNSHLQVHPINLWPNDWPNGSLPVPVVALDHKWITPWAKLMAGTGGIRFPGSVTYVGGHLTGDRNQQDPQLASITQPSTVEVSAQENLERFRITASPLAYKLAGYLAAAPLTLPIMRLVQEAMLPQSTLAHLAEIFVTIQVPVARGRVGGSAARR